MTTNKELEQIAKQVSLLNRLLELLRMQEEPESHYEEKDLFDWKAHWKDEQTQKAWSDELVKVARELINTGRLEMGLAFVFIELFEKDDWKEGLEAILNKYGRSLSE